MTKTLNSTTLQTTLTLLSVEYIKECLGSSKTGAELAVQELTRLQNAGLSGCANAKVLSEMTSTRSRDAYVLANQIKQAYPKALIVPYADFFRVMTEYNLSVGLIEHYTKFIPEENINQICKASAALKHLNLNYMYYVDKIRIDRDMPRAAVKLLSSYIARFPLVAPFTDEPLLHDVGGIVFKFDRFIRKAIHKLDPNEWLIAAPVADLPENTIIEYFSGRAEKRKRIAEDPIVFKASEIGVVIVSMWGEEANSSIFDKYR